MYGRLHSIQDAGLLQFLPDISSRGQWKHVQTNNSRPTLQAAAGRIRAACLGIGRDQYTPPDGPTS